MRPPPSVVTVLPPSEGFTPDRVGAIGLLVQRLAQPDDVVLGADPGGVPFAGCRFERVAPPRWPPRDFVRRYAAGVTLALRRLAPDLIEVHNRPALALAVRRSLPDTPLMLVLHNDPQTMRGVHSPAARAALLEAMTVATVSGWLARRFVAGVSSARAPVLLENCLDLAALPAPLTAEAREPTVLFAGRLVADKGADAFVAACAASLPGLPGWRAEMIGADRFDRTRRETPFLTALRPRAADAGVVLSGYQTHPAVLSSMARAAITVVPSRWPEPFGLTALEAMASGSALICSGRGGLAEVAGRDEAEPAALFVDPDAPGALAEAISRLAGDASLRCTLASRGHIRAQHFDAGPARARLGALRRAVASG